MNVNSTALHFADAVPEVQVMIYEYFHKLKLVCVVLFYDRIHELCFDINLYTFTGSVNL